MSPRPVARVRAGRTRRRAVLAGALGGVLVVAGLAGGGCGTAPPTEPTVASVDLRPALVIEVDDEGIAFAPGQRTKDGVTTAPPQVPGGTVVEVRNVGTGPHRVEARPAFDTGTLLPGESTTVVLVEPGEVRMVDRQDPTHTASLTVTARTPTT